MKFLPLFCLLLGLSFPSQAQFDIAAEGSVTLTTGKTQAFDFGFSYFRQEGSYRFIVGRYNLTVHTVPEKYSLALILQDGKQVWVPDFINEPLLGFELAIEDYTIKLTPNPDPEPLTGNFILQLNNENYYFSNGPGQVDFLFHEDGIKEVRVKGMFKPRR